MYGVGLDTGYEPDDPAAAIDAQSNATYTVMYYLQFMNPYLSPVTGTNTDLSVLTYDGIQGNVLV